MYKLHTHGITRLADNASIPADTGNTANVRSEFQLRRYERFIYSLKQQYIEGYCEEHHITPKCFGGTNEKNNLIRLTARQHFVAHHMLWKAYGGAMSRAFFMMSNFGKYGKVNSAAYAKARGEYSLEVTKQLTGKKLPSPSAETRMKQSLAKLGHRLTPKHIENVRLASIGRVTSVQTKNKISESKRGIATRARGFTHSDETKLKLRLANTNRALIECPHCKGTFKDHGGIKRWHLDNCRERLVA